jgi:hypothetical protein
LEIAVKRVVLLVLRSPQFLYRELGGGHDDYDMASRLSFGLWDTLPDQELLRAASAPQLHTRALDLGIADFPRGLPPASISSAGRSESPYNRLQRGAAETFWITWCQPVDGDIPVVQRPWACSAGRPGLAGTRDPGCHWATERRGPCGPVVRCSDRCAGCGKAPQPGGQGKESGTPPLLPHPATKGFPDPCPSEPPFRCHSLPRRPIANPLRPSGSSQSRAFGASLG